MISEAVREDHVGSDKQGNGVDHDSVISLVNIFEKEVPLAVHLSLLVSPAPFPL